MRHPELRPAGQPDDDVLRLIHAEVHAEMYASLDSRTRELVTALQFDAQRSQYRATHPDSVDRLIVIDGEVTGRCWTDLDDHRLHLLDLAVRPAYQRRGIAAAVMRSLLGEAERASVPLTLSVWQENIPARTLYNGLGFVQHEPAQNGYLSLRAPSRQGAV